MFEEIIEPKKEELIVEPVIKNEEEVEVDKSSESTSTLFLLPSNILRDINSAVERNAKVSEIQIIIKERYKGELRVASRYNVEKYIRLYKLEKERAETTSKLSQQTGAFQKSNSKIINDTLNSNWDVNDKKSILESLIVECKARIDYLKALPKFDIGPGTESSLQKYMSETREIIKILLQLSGELDSQKDNKIVFSIINDNLYSILRVVASTVRDVYGDEKIDLFRLKLKEAFLKNDSEQKIVDIKRLEEGDNNEKTK